MVTAEVKIINESGLHLRPAGVLTQTCIRFKSEIILYNGERKIIGKSVLNVMAAGVKKGSTVRGSLESSCRGHFQWAWGR